MIRALVVDDEPANRYFFRLCFEPMNVEVTEVDDGAKALELLERVEELPDIIFMDYRMPGMNGVDATKRILTKYPSAAIVFVSADRSVRREALEAGAKDFIQKPVELDQLLDALERIVGKL